MGWCDKREETTLAERWNVAAAAAVLVPLAASWLALVVNREGEGGWWWWGGEGNGAEGDGTVALVVVYVWSLLLFAYLVWYGNRVLTKKKENQMKVLLAALFVFANLALLCSILIGGLALQGEGAEAGWLGRWPAVMILTFVFWAIFAAAFAGDLYRKTRKGKTTSSNDYQRQDDDGLI